jgi:hypothetical protein
MCANSTELAVTQSGMKMQVQKAKPDHTQMFSFGRDFDAFDRVLQHNVIFFDCVVEGAPSVKRVLCS